MFTKILCATDGSPDAGRALEPTAALAADAGTGIDVAQVTEYFPAGRVAGRSTRADEPEVRARIEEQLAGAVLGSVTQRLLHEASSPVLAIPPTGSTAAGGSEPPRPALVTE